MIPIIRYNEENGERLVKSFLERSQLENREVQDKVAEIISEIRQKGDEALFEYTKQFDKADISKDNVAVTKEEIEQAYAETDEKIINVMKKSAERIRIFHEEQKQKSWFKTSENGEILGQLIRPLERVGVYVPGGKAAYPSSVLMNVVPAKVAGVPEIVMATPPGIDGKISPETIVAAVEAGITEIYKVGGAQAIAAFAFGTESISKVDKIVGPGNIFVALAKRAVYGYVNLDSIAGPSEILIIADETANPKYAAADLLSQAEHDELASAIFITPCAELAVRVHKELEIQTEKLERKEIIKSSLENYGGVIVVDNIDEAINLSNRIAPEHLEVCTKNPFDILPKIKNAGAVFLGNYTPEPLGDYMAGPNHVLPTGGTAKFFSPLCVDDYIKKSSILSFSEEAFMEIGKDVIKFAECEGLTAHANSVRVRF